MGKSKKTQLAAAQGAAGRAELAPSGIAPPAVAAAVAVERPSKRAKTDIDDIFAKAKPAAAAAAAAAAGGDATGSDKQLLPTEQHEAGKRKDKVGVSPVHARVLSSCDDSCR
jgi:hypothetical protein